MIPILRSDQIRQADARTIREEPIASIDLMERASQAFVDWLSEKYSEQNTVRVFCGPGNNGGDGLAIACLLKTRNFEVEVILTASEEKLSVDAALNLQRWDGPLIHWTSAEAPKVLTEPADLHVDALFGSGLNRPLQGHPAKIVEWLNASPAPVLSVDIPSGLYCDGQVPEGPVVNAESTLSFEYPKLAFLMPESESYTADWDFRSIGLMPWEEDAPAYWLTRADLTVPAPGRFSHKGTKGHSLVVGGAAGKQGAAYLSASSSLLCGAGLSSVHMLSGDNFNPVEPELMHTDATAYPSKARIAAGPGMGTSEQARQILEQILKSQNQPLVLDADALNLIAADPDLWQKIPKQSILTPHPGEFQRLFPDAAGKSRWVCCQIAANTARERELTIVLKGAYTAIALADGKLCFNSTGNPSMATAGSGDVLTGILVGLLAQGLPPSEATLCGVYLHGLAGDLASRCGQKPIRARDIRNAIPKALQQLREAD